ncbi:MAG: DNA replication and repair protein RecF [Chitinophagaceae bacterium]|nr:MAG: DNA replication and repair protein RecF [Chitinophagaceae bacterium]
MEPLNLFLQSISLTQFKNYRKAHFDFTGKIVCITGNNGKGKTNLLDAIYYLCFAKSYFNSQDSLNVQHGADGFRLEARFLKNVKSEAVVCTLKQNKKEMLLNGDAYQKLSRHLGNFPVVIIAPDDAVLINGGSEQRRRFWDSLLTQTDALYLDDLIAYQKVLQQRNGLLKNTPAGQSPDNTLLSVLDSRLSEYGNHIFEKRKQYFPLLREKVKALYRQISGTEEAIELIYQSSLMQTNLQDLLLQNRTKDILLQRTTDGIHRDDLVFLLDNYAMKQTASQGQRKNFLFALKLAQYELIEAGRHITPLLLLDDIFEKLDHERLSHLVRFISRHNFGQVFITDTEEERLKKIFQGEADSLQFITLK